VKRQPANPSDVRETRERLIQSLGFLTTPGLPDACSEDPCQLALVTFEITSEVHAGGHAHIGVP
jgi:hypothetical protein